MASSEMNELDRIRELEACLRLFVSVAQTWTSHYSQPDQQIWKAPLGYGQRRVFITFADVKRSECVLRNEYPSIEFIR